MGIFLDLSVVVDMYLTAMFAFVSFRYALYTNTRLGLLYYKNDVRKAYRKYQGEGHSLIEPTVFNGELCHIGKI